MAQATTLKTIFSKTKKVQGVGEVSYRGLLEKYSKEGEGCYADLSAYILHW